jgi:hypothetical protein
LGFGEYLSLAPAPPEARVGGRSVLLIPARAADLGPDALPADYQRLLTIVRDAAGPVTVRTVGEEVVLDQQRQHLLVGGPGGSRKRWMSTHWKVLFLKLMKTLPR